MVIKENNVVMHKTVAVIIAVFKAISIKEFKEPSLEY